MKFNASKGLIAGFCKSKPFWLNNYKRLYLFGILFLLCANIYFCFGLSVLPPGLRVALNFIFFFGCLQRISGTSSCCWCWRRRRRHGQQGVATTSGRLAMFNWPQRQWKRAVWPSHQFRQSVSNVKDVV